MNLLLFRPSGFSLVIFAAWLMFSQPASAQYTNGIYAEFNTSMGSYTCALYYAQAPKAVANLIGLATGQRSWLALPSGLVKTNPFYSGTTFHRVIAGFMNQGGSPNGLGTDGPGYAFVDEFTPSLRHDRFGVLSMANSGRDSNGSQYFITVGATPWLDDIHTVFGRIYGGSNVVYTINHVATGGDDRPLTNVLVNSVVIRRVGTAATAFDINAQGLPLVTNLHLKLARFGTNVSLTFSNRLYADTRIYSSTTLTNWTGSKLGIDLTGSPVSANTNALTYPRQFFRAAQVLYPSSTLAPKVITNRTLTMVFTNGFTGTAVISFNVSGGGTYTYNGSPGTLYYAFYSQEPFNGKLWPIGFIGPMDFDLTTTINFDTATAGGFTGTIYPPPYYYPSAPTTYPVMGSFSISP